MKKWFCLMSVLIICLAICNVSMAATNLTDIKGTRYEEAVENLIEIGLVNGYPEDNTYRPTVTVTRAQMAKMMVVALGEEGKVSAASKTVSTFSDIKSGHWAYGYVNVAKDLKIITGYPDGRFGPDEIVTYAEATTMIIRALGYEAEVEKSTEIWPNNYTTYARKLSLYNSVGSFENGKGASRGDIALLMWNMLRTGVCTVTGQTSNSGLIYGQGQKMINKYKNYTYLEEAEITSVDFDDDFEEAKVIIKDKNETLSMTMTDSEIEKYFGRELTLMYNDTTKKLVFIETEDKYDEKTGNITDTSSSKIYIDGKAYVLPSDSNIVLDGVTKLADAKEATLFLSGSTVKYVYATAAKSVQVGFVTDNVDITVNKKEGVKIKKNGSSSQTSYALIDKSDMPKEESVIIYYLNSDNELGILKEIKVEDAKLIKTLSSSQIKVGTTTYSYTSSSFVVVEATGTAVKSFSFSSIDKDDDKVYVYEYAGKTYLIVYTNAVEDNEKKTEAYNELKDYIKTVETKVSKESTYSQKTFAAFYEALQTAKAITMSSTQTKISSALTNLKDANTGLVSVSSYSTDGRIAKKRYELRTLINGNAATVVSNKSKYTTTSYNSFSSVLSDAKKLLEKTDTVESEVKNMYDDLNAAITALKLITNTQEHKDALALLNAALDKSKTVGAQSTYEATSYNTYKTAYNSAVTIKNNSDSKTATEIKNAASALETAISNLKLAIESLRNELNDLIADCIDYAEAEEDYTAESFAPFITAYDYARSVRESTKTTEIEKAVSDLKEKVKGLQTIEEKLTATVKAVEKMKTAKHVSEALSMASELPEDKLDKIEAIEEAAVEDLKEMVETANDKALSQGTSGDGSLEIAIGNAKQILNNNKATLTQIADVYSKLEVLVKKEN